MDQLISQATNHPWPAAITIGVLLAVIVTVCWIVVHRTSGAVLTAALGALVATGFSGDTSWRFAGHRLGMEDKERLGLFLAGEIALLACAVMARTNKTATAVDGSAGTPGVPGVLVWCITSVQIIPAFSESDFWGGLVRAAFGPVMAALLWHLAMGLEIRVRRPEALSTGLPAIIARELRERLLSRLGLAVRGRDAAQLTRDRATARAVRLASRKHLGPWGRAALAASVARSAAAVHGEQRHQLMQQLAGRRSAPELRTVPVASPWVPAAVPEPYPSTPLGVTGAELRAMDPLAAVRQVHGAHPGTTPVEVASICTEYGVPVSETQVRVALRAGNPDPVPAAVPGAPERPQLAAVPEPVPAPVPQHVPAVPVPGLHLDLVTEPQVRREFAASVPATMARPRRTREVHARVPETPPGFENMADSFRERVRGDREAIEAEFEEARTRTRPEPVPAVRHPSVPGVPAVPERSVPVPGTTGSGADDVPALLARARAVDDAHRQEHGRPAGIQTLKKDLGVGQPKAQGIRALLDSERRK